ncbi:MAG: nuclear transport factor 2 family protein [Verrucomicrobiota bacterium]|jgi:predicted SnoaL-like aldol condensation-catalyzing enzyme
MKYNVFLIISLLLGVVLTSTSAQVPQSQTERNKALVLEFWRVVFEAQNVEAATNYLAEDYIQHNPLAKTGRAGFVEFFSKIWEHPRPVAPTLRNPPELVIAEGDLVTLVWKRRLPEPADKTKTYEAFWFDVLRVKDGKLVEHWDCATK